MKKLGFRFAILGSILCFSLLAQAQAKKDSTLSRTPKTPTTQSAPKGNVAEAPAGTPTRAIQDLEKKADNYKTGNITAEDKANNIKLKREIITGTFDIHELSKLALDKHWSTLTPADQSSFVDLMIQLLEKKAILSKEQTKTQGKSYFVKYLAETYLDAPKTRSRVRTQIYVPKEDVHVSIDYKLVKVGNEWKIFDVIVDDASLVDNYKYQFNSIITKHGYPELVTRMKKKLEEMK